MTKLGLIYGLIAIISTSHNQMLVADYQKQYSISGSELQLAIGYQQTILGFVFSFFLELTGKENFFQNDFSKHALMVMISTCVLSVFSNVSGFGLIGKTSGISFQVVGHFKTILLLIVGYIFFPSDWPDDGTKYKALGGIFVALIGVFWYSYLKLHLHESNDHPEEEQIKSIDQEYQKIFEPHEIHGKEKPNINFYQYAFEEEELKKNNPNEIA